MLLRGVRGSAFLVVAFGVRAFEIGKEEVLGVKLGAIFRFYQGGVRVLLCYFGRGLALLYIAGCGQASFIVDVRI